MNGRLLVVAALVRPTARSLPWPLFAAGWALGLAIVGTMIGFGGALFDTMRAWFT